PEFTQDRTLLGNQSVDLIYGNLLTLPVAGGFMYVEPIYVQQRDAQSYPQLARVLVSFGGRIGFAATLNDALDQVFGEGSGEAATGPEAGEPGGDSGGGQGDNQQDGNNQTDNQQSPGSGDSNGQNGGGTGNQEMNSVVEDIQSALEKLRTAQEEGDFQAQGEALSELDAATRRYEQLQNSGG